MTHKHVFIRRTSALFLWLWALVLVASVAAAISPVQAAIVTQVHDGDTLHAVMSDGTERRVRLWAVDAPELGQPGCAAARAALHEITKGEEVRLIPRGTSYDRVVAQLLIEGGDVAEILLRSGVVLLDERYSKRPAYTRAQDEARIYKRGVWAAERTPPWVWRKHNSSRGKACE